MIRSSILLLALIVVAGCTGTTAKEQYFGKVVPPEGQQLRYVSGGEPESLDPQIGTGQPEARVYIGLFEGLTEYDPQSSEAIPGLAERWDIANNNTEFTFYLRPAARWSDGSPITAADFLYSIRRGLAPALASRSAYMAYAILYAQAYNERASFVRDAASGQFLTDPAKPAQRLVVASNTSPARGQELVPVRAEDIGVDALDDHTVRIRTSEPVPYLPGLMAHQFFRFVPRKAIERYGEQWTQPGRIITSGTFILQEWKPYDRIVLVRNPMYWDAARVRLDRITFYPLEAATTMMNLYKAGDVDAVYNHVVPAAWNDRVRDLKDYMDKPEAGAEFYWINITRSPMNDVRVRKALNMAIDKGALAQYRKTVKPLSGFVPEGVFPGYPHPAGDPFDQSRAQALLADAGYRDGAGRYDPSRFPVGEVELTYNTSEPNRQVAEFVQAQWKQNLGITVALKTMEFRTFLGVRVRREYRGVARSGWVGDYMDPFTFLDLLSTRDGNNGSGWYDPRYARLLQDANREANPQKRYALLAGAEAMLLDAQPIVSLYTPATNWMKKPYVQGMYANPLTMHPWKYVWIEHDPSKWN